MFPIRMFCNGLFAPRMFPKVGATSTFNAVWCMNRNQIIGPAISQPVRK